MSDRFSYRTPILVVGGIATALAAWSVWWVVLSARVAERTDAMAAELAGRGYRLAWAERRIDGWPYRVRVRFQGVRLEAPSGHALAVDALSAQANAYALNHWVLVAPDGVTVTRGRKGDLKIGGKAIRASVATTGGAVPRVTVELARPTFVPAPGAEPFPLTGARLVALNLRPTKDSATDADVLFRVERGTPRKAGAVDWLAGGKDFDLAATGRIVGASAFRGESWPVAARAWAAGGGALADVKADAIAGPARAEGSAARLGFAADGRLQGSVALTFRNGSGPLAALGGLGRGTPGAASGSAAARSGLDGSANAVLVFAGGRATLGPIPVAPAPKLF